MRSERRGDYGNDVCHGWIRYHYALKLAAQGKMQVLYRHDAICGE
jgi:hypothetical protein